MKRIVFILLLLIGIGICKKSISQGILTKQVEYFETIPTTQIRALEVISDSVVWFAAYRGIWGYTEDAGKTWKIDSIKGNSELNFRSMVALNDSTVLLLSIASPAYLYKTTNKGKTWRIVYQNNHPGIFFDCMKAADQQNIYAIADPIDGCIKLIHSSDAGEKWVEVECEYLPKLAEKEAFFATSNTNMIIKNQHVWIASGGFTSRIWHAPNFKSKFTSYQIPLPQREQMSGIFSMDFFDTNIGAISGGNYDKKDSILNALAISKDGGKSWKEVKFSKPIFGSCVQFKSKNELFLTGHSGTVYYNSKSKKYVYLKDQNNEELKFHTLRISSSKKSIWFAGTKGRIAKITLN